MTDPTNPRFWHDRAEATRTKAESFRASVIDRERLLKIASEYEQMAMRAEERQKSSE